MGEEALNRGAESESRSWLAHLGAVLLLFGLVGLAYANSFRAGWHFDDVPNILENSYIRIDALDRSSLVARNRVWQTELTLWRDCARKTPFKAGALSNLGLEYINRGEEDRGLAELNRALQLNPKLAEAHLNRGIAYGRKGENELALLDVNAALAINPNSAKAFYNRGMAYLRLGRADLAQADFAQAQRLNR